VKSGPSAFQWFWGWRGNFLNFIIGLKERRGVNHPEIARFIGSLMVIYHQAKAGNEFPNTPMGISDVFAWFLPYLGVVSKVRNCRRIYAEVY